MRPLRPAAALCVAVLLAAAGCGGGSTSVESAPLSSAGTPAPGPADPAPAQWRALPASPLSPRTNAVAAWTGREAVFVGGEVGGVCPPMADCMRAPDTARDGAAFDPAARTWRRIADAPVNLSGPTPPAVVDGVVYLIADGALLAYDAADDAWTRHGRVREGERWGVLVPTGDGRLVVSGADRARGEADRAYDPRTRAWTDLPADPVGPYGPRWFTATPAGLVLVGADTSSEGHAPDYLRAAVLDLAAGTWRELPRSEQIGGYRWAWSGTRLVAPFLGGADGGEVQPFPRWVPDGGTLDPATGRWGPLPGVPEDPYGNGGWAVDAMGGRWTAGGGWLYDDAAGTWTVLPAPDGAPQRAGAAVWAGDTLLAFGGQTMTTLSGDAWGYAAS